MNVLIIGSGGREHTIAWKISQSKKIEKIFCAPGNGGIKDIAELVDIKPEDINGLLKFAKVNLVDLTIVGPESPLVSGIVDIFTKEGLKVFGPSKELAMLEGSKIFAKETMERFGIPTAKFRVFDNADEAKAYLNKKGAPIVVKADGLCAGKGVVVAKTTDEAERVIDSILVKKVFGKAGERIILEDCLFGEEASILVFCDGENIVPLVSSQDHKRIFDNDKGPNTGGMGAYSPAPAVTGKIFDDIMKYIFKPLISNFVKEGKFYKGVLYAGLMLTDKGIMVLEFNARFGDPEAQAILPRLKTDLVDVIIASIDGGLDKVSLEWDERACLCVVLASSGYPGSYEKNKEISGLDDIKNMKDVFVFHAGTKKLDEKIFTDGGRVLGVTALGEDIRSAQKNAYGAVNKINFDGMYYRKDIGNKAVKKG